MPEVLQEEAAPCPAQRKPRGNPNRKPNWNPATARLAGLKSAEVKRAQREAMEALIVIPDPAIVGVLSARITQLRLVQRRLWSLCVASNDLDSIVIFSDIARAAFDHEQRLLAREKPVRQRSPTVEPTRSIAPIARQAEPIAAANGEAQSAPVMAAHADNADNADDRCLGDLADPDPVPGPSTSPTTC